MFTQKTTIYVYQKNNKTVKLLGLSHLGTIEYYNKCQRELTGCLLTEGTGKECKMDMLTKSYNVFAESLGLITQKLNYNYNPSINADIPYQYFTDYITNTVEYFDKLSDQTLSDMSRFIKKNPKMIKFILYILSLNPFKSKDYFILVKMRNYQVMLTLLRVLKDFDYVTICFGDRHMKDLAKQLEKLGFNKIKSTHLYPFYE